MAGRLPGPRRAILVTGATSGIGLALAQRLAPNHDLMLSGRRPAATVAPTLPPGAHYVEADQAQPQQAVAAILSAINRSGFDGLDHAVLNAGVGYLAAKRPETTERIRETLDVNLAFAIAAAHGLYAALAPRRGLLTLVGSTSFRGSATAPVYAASKAGLDGLGRALAQEWRGRAGVQVVHPGPTLTPMHEKAGTDPGWRRHFFLDRGDVAAMLIFAMASRASSQSLSWLRYLGGGAVFGRRL